MAVRIGQTSNMVLTDKQFLHFQVPGKGIDAVFPVNPRKNKAHHLALAPWSPVTAKITEVIPKAKAVSKVSNEEGGSPGVLIRLSGTMGEINEWLVLGDPVRERLKVGPAEILLLNAQSLEELDFLMGQADESKVQGQLTMIEGAVEKNIPLPIPEDRAVSIPGMPYKIRAIKYYKDAGLEGRKLQELSQAPNNPALTFEITEGDQREVHSIFSRFPELPSFHGDENSRVFHLSFVYKPLYLPQSDRNALWVIMAPQGKLFYRLKARGEFAQEGPLYKGNDYRTGWMDFKFSIEDFRSNVSVERLYEPIARSEEKEDNSSAVKIELNRKNSHKSIWLELGEKKTLEIGDTTVKLNYSLERESLPFSIKLSKFNIGRYEGTSNPMSFESQVEVSDFQKTKTFSQDIKMNHPLKYGGFTFYQAAFQEENGAPIASVFAVGRDPGIPIKYLGSIILILGIGIQFFARKWLMADSEKMKTVSKVETLEMKFSESSHRRPDESRETELVGSERND